jgi:CHC2 zinc finger
MSMISAIAEFKKEIGREGLFMRLHYLFDCLADKAVEIKERRSRYQESLDSGGNELERAIVSGPIKRLGKEMEGISDEIEATVRILRGGKEKDEKGVSQEMIARAKEFPIAYLVESRRGMALCVNHKERNPSMMIKGNRAYCFGCGWKGDSIAVYQKIRGASFAEAVRALQYDRSWTSTVK